MGKLERFDYTANIQGKKRLKHYSDCPLLTSSIYILILILLPLLACCGGCGQGYRTSPRQLASFSHYNTGFYYNPPTLVNDYIYIGTSHKYYRNPVANNVFIKLDATLHQVWEYPLGLKEVMGGASLDSAGNVYFVVEEGRSNGDMSNAKLYLYSLNPGGSFRWSKLICSTVTNLGMSNPAISSDDTIYVGGDKFYAFDANGSEKWSYGNAMVILNAPIIDPEGNIYFNAQGAVISLTPTGTLRWSLTTSGEYFSSPAFSTDCSKLIVAVGNSVSCLECSTGSELWKFTPTGIIGTFRASPAVDNQNNIYVGTKSDSQSVFYAIKADGSGILWKNEIGADLYSSPALGNDNTVYVGSERVTGGIRFHALDMSTGTEKCSAKLEGDPTWSSPALANDGTLYIGTMACDECSHGHVYSFDTDSTGLMTNAGSPRFHGGNENTGRKE